MRDLFFIVLLAVVVGCSNGSSVLEPRAVDTQEAQKEAVATTTTTTLAPKKFETGPTFQTPYGCEQGRSRDVDC